MMIELEQIFAEPLTTTVFLYASVAMLAAFAIAALWIRSSKRPGVFRQPRSAANARS